MGFDIPPKEKLRRSVTINLDGQLVEQIELLKREALAAGDSFSVSAVCAEALHAAIPRMRQAIHQKNAGKAQISVFPFSV